MERPVFLSQPNSANTSRLCMSATHIHSELTSICFLEQANAGVVQAVKNTFGQGTGWLAPIVLGYMTQYPLVEGFGRLSREEWEAAAVGGPPESWVAAMGTCSGR